MVDDDLTSFWMWNYSNNDLPEDITLMLKDMSELAVIEKIQLFARQYNNSWAGPKDMEIYVTKDGDSWEKIKDYTVALGADGKVNTEGYYIEFDEPVECLGYRIRITSYYDNGIGFMEIYTEGSLIENPNPPSEARLPQSSWTVTSTSKSPNASDKPASAMNDDVIGSQGFWVWDYNAKNLPEYITYTLADQTQNATVSKIEVIPFVGSNNWQGAKTIVVEATTDGSTWNELTQYDVQLDPSTGKANESGYTIELDSPVECKAIRLKITEIYNDGLAFSEIYMWGKIN